MGVDFERCGSYRSRRWRQIGNKTLTFYRAHGMGRLKNLSRRIMDVFHIHYRQDPRCRVEVVRLPVRIPMDVGRIIRDREEGYCNDWPLRARVCQLRRFCISFLGVTLRRGRRWVGLEKWMKGWMCRWDNPWALHTSWTVLAITHRISPKHCASPPIIVRDGGSSASASRRKSGDIASTQTLEGPARPKVVRPPRVMTVGAQKITLHRSLHSTLKEFFDPLRTNVSRTDFFAVYRRESGEFDRDYAKKYDEDLNASLIFVSHLISTRRAEYSKRRCAGRPVLCGQFSVHHRCSIRARAGSEPDSMNAAYMQILIHAVNGSLFPNADPSALTWTGPPPGIVTVQSLLYVSLAASLFASFPVMLGGRWVNRYTRNRVGSAADKSRDRQRKLDGLETWRFHLVIESLPVMRQFALLLLGCALSRYLWTIDHPVAGVVVAAAVLGATSYVLLTLVATPVR
jgi:hypothetical protein